MTETAAPGTRAEGRRRPALRVLELTFLAALAVCALYYWYRYPFRINSAGTSPTYDDTPRSLQVGKYAILGALTALGAGAAALDAEIRRTWRSRLALRDLLLVALALYAGARAVIAYASSGTEVSADLVGPVVAVVPLLLLALVAYDGAGLRARVARWGLLLAGGLVVLHAAVNALEFLLWQITGRLPALGYPGVSVRFGGVWDDPNSTAAFSAAFLVFLAARRDLFRPNVALALAIVALYNVGVAWSYSAWLLLLLGIAILIVLERRWLVLAAGTVLVGITAVAMVLPGGDTAGVPGVGRSIEEKKGSLELRGETETHIAAADGVLAWIFGSNRPGLAENAFSNWLAATGIVGLALFVAWIVAASRDASRAPRGRWVIPFVLAVAAASFFIPYLSLFPVAGFFVIVLSLAAALARPAA